MFKKNFFPISFIESMHDQGLQKKKKKSSTIFPCIKFESFQNLKTKVLTQLF